VKLINTDVNYCETDKKTQTQPC